MLARRQLTWLITGTSSGFGYRLALLALQRGDKVLAIARSLPKLQRLVDEVAAQDPAKITSSSHKSNGESMKDRLRTFRLDLGDSEKVVKDVVEDAVGVWGGVDVLVNNAGWGHPGLIEEQGIKDIQHLIDTNIMGTVKLTFAVLPHMRAQKSGTVVTIGSRSVWRAEFAGIGSYAMVKAAIHAFSENLSTELAPFNIRTLLAQPGGFRTEGIYSHGWNSTNPISDYDDLRDKTRTVFSNIPGKERGDPWKAATAIVDIVRGEGIAKGRDLPKYLILGDDAENAVRNKCQVVLDTLDEWKDVTRGVNFDE
ncbi:NAD(P)-binding protein [Macrolepiota fuliginosa MF-IS2]|uniref:NAD(P)-binding protein n=1 Tax=Macrolepiota fuliginosa MF-IS2 TaxID=1400762 RepID=A0A9P5XF12_9AGAR|nr:NAD(P)-binding protein [Macrolepiota fuliginosa MF-IS2]